MVEPLDWRAPKPDGLDEPRLIEETGQALRIAHLATPQLGMFGLRLVRAKISAAAGATVQIMAERPDGTMTIDDCERASQQLSAVFDVEDIMPHAWRLEVSSPGIDRPLVRRSDFERAAGHEARIELHAPHEGRKRWRGRIEGLIEGESGPAARVLVTRDDKTEQTVELPVSAMTEARLVLTEDLIRAALRREKQALKAARRGEAGAKRREAARRPAKAEKPERKRKTLAGSASPQPKEPHEGD